MSLRIVELIGCLARGADAGTAQRRMPVEGEKATGLGLYVPFESRATMRMSASGSLQCPGAVPELTPGAAAPSGGASALPFRIHSLWVAARCASRLVWLAM